MYKQSAFDVHNIIVILKDQTTTRDEPYQMTTGNP